MICDLILWVFFAYQSLLKGKLINYFTTHSKYDHHKPEKPHPPTSSTGYFSFQPLLQPRLLNYIYIADEHSTD